MTESARRPLSIHGPTIPERKWIRLLNAWQRSGLQGSEWCRDRGVKVSAFRFWKKEIPDRARRRQQKGNSGKSPDVRLVRARVVAAAHEIKPAPLVVVLVLLRNIRHGS